MMNLLELDEETLYDHICERYMELNANADDLKQDLGIENKEINCLEIDIEPDVSIIDSKKSRRRRNKKVENFDSFSFNIDQSITSLYSSQDNNNSTTGYVLWSTTPFFIKWLLYSEGSLPLREGMDVDLVNREGQYHLPAIFNNKKTDHGQKVGIIELGTGISSILTLILSNYVDRYLATDQRGILNKLKSNIKENLIQLNKRKCVSATLQVDQTEIVEDLSTQRIVRLETDVLDWETFQLVNANEDKYPYLQAIKQDCKTVYIMAMDVIYNEYLIEPFLGTLKRLRDYYMVGGSKVVCLVGMHMRSEGVVTEFLETAILEYDLPIKYVDDMAWNTSRHSLYII